MTTYSLKNLDKTNDVEVRIYSADGLNIVGSNTDFINLDISEKSIGVRLGPDYSVNCTGAINHAGILDSVITTGTVVATTEGIKTTVSNDTELASVLGANFGLNVFAFEEYVPPQIITATYDSYRQTITVTGNAGKEVSTKTVTGTVIGSGTIGASGSVTYGIEEGTLPNGTVLQTQVHNSNVVEHGLIASFRVASGLTNPEVPWFSITKNMVENMAYVPFDSDAVGNILIEYVGKETIEINLAEHRGNNSVDPYPTTWKNGEEIWDVRVRFKNLNTPIYLDISEADYIYNFYDDGVSNIGYHIKSTGTTYALKVKQIPDSIPTTLVNMNFMFAVDDSNQTMFEAGVIDTIANWDVSHVTSMQGTFYGTPATVLPIADWVPLSVTDMTYMFAESTSVNTDLSQWCVPLVTSLPVGFNTLYLITGTASLPANYYPVWGTCPRGENILPIPADEMHFITLAGSATYAGNVGDKIVLSNGTIIDVTTTNEEVIFTTPAGTHKVILADVVDRNNYVSIAGEALVELVNFPTLASINKFNFAAISGIGAPNLVKVPTTLPSHITDLSFMFFGASVFNQLISSWNVSQVTDMSSMFENAFAFNQDISGWDVGGVTNMQGMFTNAAMFDQPLNSWNTVNVTSLFNMFNGAASFNQPLNGWNTSKVTNMAQMFNWASLFNQDLSGWDTSNVYTMSYMFNTATNFNGDISTWNTSNVIDMEDMFSGASVFNSNISNWNTELVTKMSSMFRNATAFDQDLSQWCVPLILSLPSGFAINATLLTSEKHPVWGTCPRGENLV